MSTVYSDFHGLTPLISIGTDDYRQVGQMSRQEYDEAQSYLRDEGESLGERTGIDGRPAKDRDEQARWDRAYRDPELKARINRYNAVNEQLKGRGEVSEYETSDGVRYVHPGTEEESAFLKEMAARGEKPRRVSYYRTQGTMDAYGETKDRFPVTLRYVEGDERMGQVIDWLRQNPEAKGRLLPEMYAYLGVTHEQANQDARAAEARGRTMRELRASRLKAKGKLGAAEQQNLQVGFGGRTLGEQNDKKGWLEKSYNYFNAKLNPVAGVLDEYGQATEAELGTPEGLDLMRQRVAEGRSPLTAGEKLALGLVGEDGLDTAEKAYDYILGRRQKRLAYDEQVGARGTTFWADTVEATNQSARMGAEFALVNTLTGGGAMATKAGKALTTAQRIARSTPAMGVEMALHGPAKTAQNRADAVTFDPASGNIEVTGKGMEAVEAALKGYAAPLLEYNVEMFAMDALWKPIGRGIRSGASKVAPSKVKDFAASLAEKYQGSGLRRTLDAVAASPGMDVLRKVSERTGFRISPMGVVEESILEEVPSNVISAAFDLEGASDREGGLWGQVGGGASDAWGAFIDTLKASPSMALSVLLMGGGTGVAVKGTTGLINYGMSTPRVRSALRELGATDAELKGKSKEQLNDLLFQKLRDVKVDPTTGISIYDPAKIEKMGRPELEQALRGHGWADMDDLSGVTDEQMRTRLLNGYREMGAGAWTDSAIKKIWNGFVSAYGHRMNHSNIMERLEADIFQKSPRAFDAETREAMREVALLRSMAGSGQFRGTLAGELMDDVALSNYARLPETARIALDDFEDGFLNARKTAIPTYDQIGRGVYQPSTFRQPMRQEEMNNNGEGGYMDFGTGISLTPVYAEGSKTPRWRVDVGGTTMRHANTQDEVDAALGKLGIIPLRVRLPHGAQNIFDSLEEARRFADRVSSYNNTLKQELLTKAQVARAMYARVRGKNGNGIVTLARPGDAPADIRDEMMDALRRGEEGRASLELIRRFQSLMGFTSARDGKTYVFLDNHNSPYTLLQTVQHEGFHEGLLSAFLGDRKLVNAFIDELKRPGGNLPGWVHNQIQRIDSQEGVEELLASIAEMTDAGPGLLRTVNRAMRKAMALDGAMSPSEQDVNSIVYGAWKARRMTPDMMPKTAERSGSFGAVTGIGDASVVDASEQLSKRYGEPLTQDDVSRARMERGRQAVHSQNQKEAKPQPKRTKVQEPPPRDSGADKEEESAERTQNPPSEEPLQEEGVRTDLPEDEGEATTTLDEDGEAEQQYQEPERHQAEQTAPQPPPKDASKPTRKGQVTSIDELTPEEEEQKQPSTETQQPPPEPEGKQPEPVPDGTVRNGRIAWEGKWLKPGGIRGHQGVFISDTEDGEPLAFFQTEDWGLGDNETKPMRRGTPVVDHYHAAMMWKAAGTPGLEEAKAQLPVEEVDGVVSEDGYIRWEKFWLKPGTHNGEEGYFIHDERGGQAKGFYKPGAWRTKAGKERPGKVTNFVDDKLTGERVSAAYRWSKHEKMLEEQAKKQALQPEQPHETPAPQAEPEAQEPQETPAPTPRPEQATEPETTQEAPTLKVLKEDEDGRSVHVSTKGITNTKSSGRFFEEIAAVKDAAVRAGLAPQDAIVVGVDTNGAVVAFDEDAETLENVAPTYMPVTMVVGGEPHQVYAVKWSDPEVAGAIVDFFDKHTVVTVDRRNNAAKITKPKNWEQQVEPQQAQAEPTQEPLAQREPQAQADALTYEALLSLPPNEAATALATGKISTEQLLEYVRTDPWQHLQVAELVWQDKHEANERGIPYIAANARVKVPPTAEAIVEILHSRIGPARLVEKKRQSDETNVKRPEKAKKPAARPAKPSEPTQPQPAPSARTPQTREEAEAFLKDHVIVDTGTGAQAPQQRPEKRPTKAQRPKKTTAATQELQEVEDLLGGLGMLREGALSPENADNLVEIKVEPSPQTGMTREGVVLTAEQTVAVQNAMQKLVNASIEKDGTRTFQDFAERLFGTLGEGKRNVWDAMRPYLRNAWNQYGDMHEDLGLDEVSRADAKAVFERVERGEVEPQAPAPEPAQEPQPQAEPTATPAAPAQQPAQPEPVAQAPQAEPQQVPTDWASAKNGEIRMGEDGKAYIRWEDYWMTPTTGKVRKWVGSRKRGRMETVEVEGVNVHDRMPDGKPGAQAKVFFEPDGRWVNPNNGKVHYGHMQALVDDPKNGYRWTALDSWADDGNPRADMANAREAMERGTLGAVTEPQQKEDEHERTGIQSASGQVGGAVGGQEPSRDGRDGVGGVGAGVPGRDVPESRGADVPAGLADEQPADGVSDDAAGAGGRADEGGPGSGTATGAEAPVQREGGRGGVRERDSAEQTASGDRGRGRGEAQGVQPPAQEPNHLTNSRPAKTNYVIPEEGNGGIDAIDTPRKRIEANLAALRLLKRLEKEGRQATPEEQRILSLYTGWGSLGEQLFNDDNPDWATEREELKGLLTQEEYNTARRTTQYAHYTPMNVVRGMYDALTLMGVRGANLSAFEAGLGVGRFIGGLPQGLLNTRYTGVEMDPLTASIAAQLYPQATVVKMPYQDVGALHNQFDFIVGNPPYGDIRLSDKSFPDGNGKSLHNFFIMKQIEALRPGGVAAFLVTHYFLDGKDQSARLWIHQRAQFLGAIRMPNALFKSTDANLVTDIVFFRKRLPGEEVPAVTNTKKGKYDEELAIPDDSQWIYTTEMQSSDPESEGLSVSINMAFTSPSTHRPGVFYGGRKNSKIVKSTRYGADRPRGELVVRGDAPTREGIRLCFGGNNYWLEESLRSVFRPYEPPAPTEQETRERLSAKQVSTLGGGASHPSLLAGGHFVGADGKLYYTTKGFDGKLVAWPVTNYNEQAEEAEYAKHPRETKSGKNKGAPAKFSRWKDVQDPFTKFTPKEQDILKTLVKLREIRFDLMQEELSENANEERMSDLRKQLGEAYGTFQKAAKGYAGTKARAPALNDNEIKALISSDPAMSQLLGLETLKKDKNGKITEVVKSAVFSRRVNEPKWHPLDHYDNALDALTANLTATGTIDLDWIAGRTGKNRATILEEMKERVFIDPEMEQPVLRELYLSGDVKTKLEEANRALDEGHEEYRRNVIALGAVVPADIDVGDLYVPLGSPILTSEMIGRFAQSEMGFVHRDDVRARFNTLTGTWEASVKNEPADLAGRYFTANRAFRDVMKAALNNKTLPIYDRLPDGSSVLNAEATEQVAETIRQIRDQWEMWWPTSSDATEIGKRYNERYNRIAETRYDGSFLKFQGLNPKLTPYQHQRDAVWRTIVTGNVLYNHVVGSGKTNTAILSIMEMKRMGRVRKPIVVVPNHLVEQWRNDFLAAYPGANVLATDPSDLNAENRKRYFSRIQNGDYDVIILPHSQLSRISLSADTLRELANEQLAKYREALDGMKKEGSKLTVSRIEKMVQKLEERIRAKLNALKTDETGLFFDTLGIDGIFLDEAHEFKNVPFISSVQAKGMGNPSGSNKAFDLLMKINWFRKKRAGSPVVFMTGTPVSNSLTELYLNMLYMAPDLLEKADLNSMDAFLGAFGLVDERMEVATTGQFKPAKRLRKLMNAPELMSMVRTYMDAIDADDLRGSMEAVGRTYDVPEMEGGAPINIVAKRSPLQELYFGQEIAKQQKDDGTFVRAFNEGSIYFRSQHMPKDLSIDNMLKVTNDAMAASLDIRLRKQALIAMGVSPSELTDEALDFAGSKVNLCVAQIVADYKRFNAVKGTQMVFCDRSIPGSARASIAKDLEKKRKELEKARKEAEREELDPTAAFKQRSEEEESPAEAVVRLEREVQGLESELESGFSVYDDIKQKLVAQGIPAEEIAFIHDYNTKEKKQALFDSMNEGNVRVLLGSTSRMGAGTNANKRMVSLHHLDAPWRPSDMEQRNGRIIRQGNLLMKEVPDFKVRIYQYGTERSADAFKFSTLLEKGRAFHGIFKRTNANRNVEDIGDEGLSAEQMMAQLSGSLLMPLSIEKREAVQALERQFRNHSAKRRNLMEAYDTANATTPVIEDNLARAKRVTGLATEREQNKDNYYTGLDLRDAEGKPIALEAKTQKERIEDKQEKPLSVLLHDGATLRYRGLDWVPTRPASQNGDRYDVFVELQAFDPSDTSPRRRILAVTTQYAVRGTKDDGIITRMNNTIEKAKASIPLFEGELKSNAALVEKLDKQLEEYPEAFPKAQELLEAKREFADIQRCVNADATNAAEARVTLGHYYGQKGLPVPEYEWTKPEFDEKHGVSQQTGMARGGWEKELQEKLDRAGMTEADLSMDTQALLAAKRAHEAAMPRSRIGKAVDFIGEVITPREGEARREFIKRKGHEAAENLGKKLVDVRIPLINAVKEIVGDEKLPEDEDIATAMQLSYGRITAQHADIDADYVRPVLDILVKQGMQVSDLDIYLSAKFAPERNKMIRERAEWKDAGAGISDEAAAARLRGMREQFTKTQMDALEKAAQIVYKMNRANLARLVASGILPQKQVEEWVKLSTHYVPLRDDLERLGAADVSGSMKHGRPFQKAVGRYSEALDSSFGWSVIQAKQGVIWAEQNRINKITVNFAKNHLSPEDYFVSKVPIKAEKVFSERKGYKQEDAVPLRLDRPEERNIAEQYLKAGYTVVRSTENRNVVWVDGGEMDRVLRVRKGTDAWRTAMPQNVVARIDGKRVYVFFDETKGSRGNKMGLAINRANMVHWDNRLWNTIAWLTRIKAMASTVWSVTFAARNAINDILQTSGITLMEGKYGVTKDVFKNYGQALKAFTAWRVSGQYDESTEMGAYLKEAVKQGMLTGIYGKSSNFDQTMLDSVIAPLAVLEHRTGFGKNVKDTVAYSWSQVLAATSTFSEIPEVGVRLAVYAAMRQHGATATEATVYAREITLDYNKKGEWTPVTNTLWMFSNASIQSLARWKKAWQTGNWKSRTIGVTFLLAAGFFTQLYNIMFASLFFGGDDDELYKNIPDYAYDNSIPILLPGGKSYLTIPNRGPQAAITRIGASLANLLVGDDTPTGFLSDASVVLNPAFLENANPAGSSGSFLQTVSPTILDPAIQLAENKAWTGAPVHAMNYGNSAAPKWQDGFEKTSLFSKWVAKLLSDATGGDDVQGGKIDVYPEQVELVKNFIIGSIGTDFSGLSDMARGDFGNMPVMRGFVRPLPDNTHRYYEIKADVEKNLQIMQGYAVSSREKYERHLEQHPYLLNAKGFRRVKAAIEKLVDLRREQLALGQDTSETDKLLEEYRQLYIDFYEGKM